MHFVSLAGVEMMLRLMTVSAAVNQFVVNMQLVFAGHAKLRSNPSAEIPCIIFKLYEDQCVSVGKIKIKQTASQ